ncbi:unnamed protein product [Echinostoma caproni]|uniref:G_PROTEIN_RECEP_F1_2 domain-containing protein n=1 Tax=Echinostoma caproni TaxID=27848 RepID=A0A183ADM3_9TREM|nr:unnamed protein product [Echinostoma caproni]
MVITVATLYAVSQLPRHVTYLVTVNSPKAFERETMMYVWLVCHFCTWSATCYNLFIYAWMNRAFRRGLYDLIYLIFYWFCCCCSACFCWCGNLRESTLVMNGNGAVGSEDGRRRWDRRIRPLSWSRGLLRRAQRNRKSSEPNPAPETVIEFGNLNLNGEDRLESGTVSDAYGSDDKEGE